MTERFKKISSYVLMGLLIITSVFSVQSIMANNNSDTEVTDLSNSLEGQTIVFMGDSITQNFEDEGQSYPDIVAENLNIDAVNLGLGGTSMSTHPNKYFNSFSFTQLIHAFVGGDFSSQEAALSNEDIPDYFQDKLEVMKGINWDDVDIVAVMYGANDWSKQIQNDNNLKDVNTFIGAGRTGVETLITAYPHVKFLFIPTTYRFWPENNLDSTTAVNSFDHKPSDFSEAMAQLAQEYNFPAVDSYYGLGLNSFNRTLYFNSNDGTHPNQRGTNRLADLITNTLEFYY